MPATTPIEELSSIRAKLRSLRAREAELMATLRHRFTPDTEEPPQPRPGWPIQRIAEVRAR